MPTSGGLAIWLGIVLPLAGGQIVLWGLSTAGGFVPEFVAPHLPGLLYQSGRLWTLLAGGTVLMLVSFALAGSIPLTVGVIGHEGSTVIVVMNSLRLLFGRLASDGAGKPG